MQIQLPVETTGTGPDLAIIEIDSALRKRIKAMRKAIKKSGTIILSEASTSAHFLQNGQEVAFLSQLLSVTRKHAMWSVKGLDGQVISTRRVKLDQIAA